MQRFTLLLTLVFLVTSSYRAQTTVRKPGDADLNLKRLSLISSLQGLDAQSLKLNKPLALALAKAEIADAAWSLDRVWAKKLLREAFELTFPEDEERRMLRNRPIGAPPTIPTADEVGRNSVRNR